jgi:hypothetical protein
MVSNPYRPPQWTKPPAPETVVLTFPGQPQVAQYSATGITATLPTAQTQYVFDAVIRNSHEQRVRKTLQPVQTGASIADHAYVEPARVSLDIGMSDAMDVYATGIWVGARTKSVSCFQVMVAMSYARVPLALHTKLRDYKNMVIESITAEDTARTIAGLRMRVEFGEIFAAKTVVIPNSARPQDTQQNNLGNVNPQPPTPTQVSQNQVGPGIKLYPAHTCGAGTWCSVNTANLPALPVPSH